MANVDNGDGTFQLDLMGGCNFIVDPQKPHLGGNMGGGDQGTDYSKDLWPWMVKRYAPKRILDVGCAEGHAMRAFRALGVDTVGLEGLAQNAKKCPQPTYVHDLTLGWYAPLEAIDMVWCCDVVEHVEERFVENILKTFQCAPLVALCHGTEGMAHSGWHHVNNKSVAYWAEKMQSAGYVLDEEGTKESHIVTKGRSYWPESGRFWRKA
jgi:hypothetical protein